MGKFAGFLKRAKKIAGIGMNVLDAVNNIYKGVNPFVEPIVSAIPYGSAINTGLNVASNVIDKIQPFTNRWLTDKDKNTSNRIANGVQKIGGTVAQGLVNKYMDVQDSLLNSKGRNNIFGDILNN